MVGNVLKFVASRHHKNVFPKLNSYIKLLYSKVIFLKGHFQHDKSWRGGGFLSAVIEILYAPDIPHNK